MPVAKSSWGVLILVCMYTNVYQTTGGNYTVGFIRHGGRDPKQIFIFTALDDKVDLSIDRFNETLDSFISLTAGERLKYDFTSPDNTMRVGVENKGILIMTSSDIHVLVYDETLQSTDILIPRKHEHLGQQYAVITHCSDDSGCVLSIVAVEPEKDTFVGIILPTSMSQLFYFRGKNYTGGDVICARLTSHQTFSLILKLFMTGTVIVSNLNLAVFVGAGRTRVELPESDNDHIMEAVPPTDYWGTHYFLVKLDSSYTDYVKIIAAMDNTVVTIASCHGTETMLIEKAFEDYVAYEMTCDYNYISTELNNYILVGHFIRMRNGNPALYYPLPKKHFSTSYVISSPPISLLYLFCKIVVVARSRARIKYNSLLSVYGWTEIPNTVYSFASFPVSTFGIKTTITDTRGTSFGGYLCCYGSDTTAATALMPLSYDPLQITPFKFWRQKDSNAVDKCNRTKTSRTDHTTTEQSMAETSTAISSVHDASLITTLNTTFNSSNITNLSTPTRTPCACSLCRRTSSGITTAVDINKFLEEMKSKMLIKKNETSAWKRKMTCAKDPRPSSHGIGLVGSLLLCFVVGIILLIDVTNYCLVFRNRAIGAITT